MHEAVGLPLLLSLPSDALTAFLVRNALAAAYSGDASYPD